MEKLIRHFNTSPSAYSSGVKKRHNGYVNSELRCFGVRLDELCSRNNTDVPNVVVQMCAFLRAAGGFHTEGVFRVNGNARVIENLRSAADESVSADDDFFLSHLERFGDIHSVASLIKLFLRELPIGLVPPSHTKELLENYSMNSDESLTLIERVICTLPPPNYRLLEYLCCFLRQMLQFQSQNKMNSTSIGIVFGPNVFRCPRDLEGLSSQNIINSIMSTLVEKSDVLFNRAASLDVPSAPQVRKKRDSVNVEVGVNSPSPGDSDVDLMLEAPPRSSTGHRPRQQRGSTSFVPFTDSDRSRIAFIVPTDLDVGQEHQSGMLSTSDTESQTAVLNMVSDVAEQLTSSLQACLRTCVRQHALPTAAPSTPTPLAGGQGHDRTPTDRPAVPFTNWLGNFVGAPTASLLSPVRANSNSPQPASSIDGNSQPMKNVSTVATSFASRPRPSPSLQIPPPPKSHPPSFQTPTNASSASVWVHRNQHEVEEEARPHAGPWNGRSLLTEPADLPGGTPRQSMDFGDIFSVSRQTNRKSKAVVEDSGWRPSSSDDEAGRGAAAGAGLGDTRWAESDDPEVGRGRSGAVPAHSDDSASNRSASWLQLQRAPHSVAGAFHQMSLRMAEKRRANGRPERLLDMTLHELEAEKVMIQRALLAYESTFGRPRDHGDRVVMRPIYDRYRLVKRLLATAPAGTGLDPNAPARDFAPQDVLSALLEQQAALGNDHAPQTAAPRRGCAPRESAEFHGQFTSSGVNQANSRTPDEWFGSLGISTRTSNRNGGRGKNNDRQPLFDGEDDDHEEDDTVGRRTPVNRSSPTRSPIQLPVLADPPSPRSPSHNVAHYNRNMHNHFQSAAARPNHSNTYFGVLEGGTVGSLQSQLFSQPPRQMSIYPSAPRRGSQNQHHHFPQTVGKLLTGDDPESGKPMDQAIADYVNKYATFSLSELKTELESVKESKKVLQKFLKEFEHDFERKRGRKVELEDRMPLNPEYMHYKMLKARLVSLERLLEARSSRI